jgi:lipopolysaccharide transport system permease protein
MTLSGYEISPLFFAHGASIERFAPANSEGCSIVTKVIYTSNPVTFSWRHVAPWSIWRDLLKHRGLIGSMTVRDFRSAYQASYFGMTWQVVLPIIMLAIFYLVFGRILGGRFSNNATETPIEYALALFVGLGFFNFLAQNIGSAPSLITSNVTYVKTLSFPLEILSVNAVLNAMINLLIGLILTSLILVLVNGHLYWSAICTPFYVLCTFLLTLGVSWGLSALAVFVRDVSAVTSPLTLILMFMCPIFYPASMVPKRIKWIIATNPISVIIEDVRASFLYGVWPEIWSMVAIFLVSLFFAVAGYFFFMRSKSAFADVM